MPIGRSKSKSKEIMYHNRHLDNLETLQEKVKHGIAAFVFLLFGINFIGWMIWGFEVNQIVASSFTFVIGYYLKETRGKGGS